MGTGPKPGVVRKNLVSQKGFQGDSTESDEATREKVKIILKANGGHGEGPCS